MLDGAGRSVDDHQATLIASLCRYLSDAVSWQDEVVIGSAGAASGLIHGPKSSRDVVASLGIRRARHWRNSIQVYLAAERDCYLALRRLS
jgi:hypothetical protein